MNDAAKEAIVGAAPAVERRRAAVAAALAQAAGTQFVPWRGGYRQVPLVRLDARQLVYRADNGRLVAELAALCRQRGESLDDLAARQDSAAVQRQLHRLLLAKAGDPQGPILQELQRQGQQIEPLLITREAVVVNGNRRLAAMRALHAEAPERYGGFAEVAAAVLPAETGAADIELIEAALQMAPETKLAYGWINRRLKLRRQHEALGLPVEDICAAYRLEDPAQLARELAELALAEDYLENFRGTPGDYAAVAEAEALFTGLQGELPQLPPELRAAWRLAGFTLIDGRAAVDAPLERHFPFAAPQPPDLPARALARFAEEMELQPADAAETPDAAMLAALTRLLATPRDSGERAGRLHAVMETLRAEHQERQRPARMLRRVREARQMMDRLDPTRLTEAQRRQLRGDVAAIHAQAAYLLGEHPQTRFEQRKTGLLRAVERLVTRPLRRRLQAR